MDMSTKARSQALYVRGSLFKMRGGIKTMKTGLLSTITNCRLKEK
jgi:hypothetical protein